MKRFKLWRQKRLWVATMIQLVMYTTASNNNEPTKVKVYQERADVGLYAWSAWGSWSPCSRSCGGGVSYQERQCLPRSQSLNTTLAPPVTERVTRQASRGHNCAGVARRYHECNTQPCRDGSRDPRVEQCSTYDRRPFRGRYYTWVPYIDGDAPCLLNCRPLGHHFYASLSLVEDGTPCTLQGYRAICVQGSCKAVGRESVLSIASTREVKCGRRLVSGLFARPRLPLGYSYITTVPQGACRLNVSEILSSDNYIALKVTNGSYIMNGEFAVSAPGIYEAAGARFTYSRNAGLDTVFASGPIHFPIDIMILYTEPNPSIKYEYFTDAMPGEVDIESISKEAQSPTKHIRRHHGFDYSYNVPRHPDNENTIENVVGSRKFLWKILSYTQCSRSCGGGFQIGKYRCVEATNTGDREVSPAHCAGAAPGGKRRRCGNVHCPPRWRAAAWSPCPQCGPATRTRIVGCVQDHSKGITKISDVKCPAPKPAVTEKCNIPDCNDEVAKPSRNQVDAFRDGPVFTLDVDSNSNVGPEYNFGSVAWLYTNWTECVGWCVGGGIQTRAVRCADPSGCAPKNPPEYTRKCPPKISCDAHEGHWFTGDWSACTSSCEGKQVRGVLCIGGTGRHLKESACKAPRPESERSCGQECTPVWFTSDWGQCIGNCTLGIGVQHRTVVCARGDQANETMCESTRPHATQPCAPRCPDSTKLIQSGVIDKTTQRTTLTTGVPEEKDCEDKLTNCALVVQARLCHYKYYIQNCCNSCRT